MGILHHVAELHMIYLAILGHSRERKNPVLANKYGKVYGYIYIFSAVSTYEKKSFLYIYSLPWTGSLPKIGNKCLLS